MSGSQDDERKHGFALVIARRVVPVVLDGSVETGDKLPVPRVGVIASYAVSFSEATEYTDPGDPRLTTIRVQVEAGRGGQPFRNTGHDGAPIEQPDRWSSNLHADGFSAQWVSLRPPPSELGPVELRGRLTIDFGALCSCWVRGRVTGLWMTYARRKQHARIGHPASWEPVWGSQGRIMLPEWPTRQQDWPALPVGANESGMMVELDLDDVPDGLTGGTRRDGQPPAPRPRAGRRLNEGDR